MRDDCTHRHQKTYEIIGTLLAMVTLAVIYIAHREVPFMMDDEWYSTKLFSDEPICNVADIFEAQYWHYNNWGGRSVAHFILQLTLLLSEKAADLLNVIVTVVLGVLICKIARVKSMFFFAMVAGMLYAFNANWKMSMHWQSGSANYLYITVLILLFLRCYFEELEEESGCGKWKAIWILPLGLLAGWSNENMGPTVWILTILSMLVIRKKGRNTPIWMYLGSLGSFAGSVLVILAPGNFVRSKEAELEGYGTLWKVFLRCYAECKASFEYIFLAVFAIVFVLILANAVDCTIRMETILMIIGALLSWGAMVLAPHYPDRATFGTMVFLVCAIMITVKDVVEKKPNLKLPLCASMCFLWLRGMYFLGEYISIVWGWIK